MAIDVGSAVGYLDLDISGFLNGLKTAQSEANFVTNNMANKIGSGFSKVGNSLSSVGSTLTKSVTLPLVAVGTAGLKVATDFEKGMSEVKAITQATGDDFTRLKDLAVDLGGTTSFSAGEVAEAMTEMAKAGWDVNNIIDGMSGVLDAAAASGEGLGIVSTIVADAITGFGLKASESAKVADLLTQAANSGTIGINDLGESFKYVAPIASSMGVSIEDATTAIAAMSMAGIKGSQAGTTLRSILSNMTGPIDIYGQKIGKVSIATTNADGTMRKLGDVLEDCRVAFAGLTEAEKAQAAEAIVGKEAMSGLLSLLNLSQDEYDAIAKSMEDCSGVAKETASVMQDNLQSKVEQLGGSLESLAIKLADYIIPYAQRLVEWLTNLVDKFTNLDPATQKIILKFGAFALAAGPVISIVGKLITGIGSMITTFGKVPMLLTTMTNGLKNIGEGFTLAKAGFSGLATQAGGFGTKLGTMAASIGPWGIAIVAVIAIVIAAFTNLWKNNEEFREKVIAIWGEIKATFDRFCKGIVDSLNKLGFDFENIGEVLKAIWQGFCDFLGPYFIAVFQYISDTFSFFVDIILNVLNFFVSLFTGDWEGCWNSIKGIFVSTWNYIIGWFENIGRTFYDILNVILGWFGTSWSECWSSIKQFFVDTWNSILSFFQNIGNNISSFFTNVWNGIYSFFVNILGGIINYMSQWCGSMASKAREAASNVYNNIVNGLSSLPNRIKEIGRYLVQGLWNGISSAGSWLKDKIKSFGNTIIDGFKKAFNINSPSKETEDIGEFITQGLIVGMENEEGGLLNAIQNIVNDIMDKMIFITNAVKNLLSGNLFPEEETSVLDAYNATLTNTLNIYKLLSEQMKLCLEYARSLAIVDNGLLKLGSKFKGTSSFSIFNNTDIETLKELILSVLGKDNPNDNNDGNNKPDQLVIPISIGDEQIETVIVDLLRREVRV